MFTLQVVGGITSDRRMETGTVVREEDSEQDTLTTTTHIGTACLPAAELFEVEPQVTPRIGGRVAAWRGDVHNRSGERKHRGADRFDLGIEQQNRVERCYWLEIWGFR
jgi:hypothetical protein